MAAVADIAGPFARHGLTILRGTGLRLGELLDLELDCLVDFARHGTGRRCRPDRRGRRNSSRPVCDFLLGGYAGCLNPWVAVVPEGRHNNDEETHASAND